MAIDASRVLVVCSRLVRASRRPRPNVTLRSLRREGTEEPAERALRHTRLLDVDRAGIDRASRIDPVDVRSLDAIHLDAAVTLAGRGEIAAVLTLTVLSRPAARTTASASNRLPVRSAAGPPAGRCRIDGASVSRTQPI